ncbi:MAG: carboxypeptidase-like regulatory domain-containing protein [Chitinophagales bacterium]|nr:carboxypeptidase-like regulatory domain-containing protein [Chitinophagales bacterium]
MPRFLFFMLWCAISATGVWAQDIVLTGKVIDAQTHETVPFANIRTLKKTTTTSSNLNGEFEWHLPASALTDSLAISCIGYETRRWSIARLAREKEIVLAINPKTYSLQEVVITPNSGPKAADIIQKAIDHIPDNYPVNPFVMHGFYREYFRENGNFVAFAEASVNIHDPEGYRRSKSKKQNKAKEIIQVEELRVSDICNKGDYVLYIDLNYALRSNFVRNVDFWKDFGDQMNYKTERLTIDEMTYLDKDLVYVISYDMLSRRTGRYSGKLYIRSNDYAVLKIELNVQNSSNANMNGAPQQTKATMTFAENSEGKLCLNYINANHELSYIVNDQQYQLHFFSELIVNHSEPQSSMPMIADETVLKSSIFYQPRYRTFAPEYWKSYKLFENSLNNTLIINDLQRTRPLDTQYKANGKLKIGGR